MINRAANRPALVAAAALLVLSACGSPQRPAPPAGATSTPAPRPRLLVFSRTAAFRHASIAAGVATLRDLGAANGFGVDATEDAAAFTSSNLGRYRAIVFLSTTGDVLNPDQE